MGATGFCWECGRLVQTQGALFCDKHKKASRDKGGAIKRQEKRAKQKVFSFSGGLSSVKLSIPFKLPF